MDEHFETNASWLTNMAGTATSSNAVLTALFAPTITRQPQSVTAPWGNGVLFTVSASGTRPLSYQWRFNGANLPSETNAVLTLAGVQPSDGGEYFANTNLDIPPVVARLEGPVDFNWTNNWPGTPVPSNYFSVRWSGKVESRAAGDYTFYVSALSGAEFRLSVRGQMIIDTWDNPDTSTNEWWGTLSLSVSNTFNLRLEYRNGSSQPRIKLSWQEPNSTNKVVVPVERLVQFGQGPTGVSVDASGKIWAANYDSDNVMRIDPNAGILVTNNGVVSHLGEVDLVVDLGDGSGHPPPYDQPAWPYNYSDMTGFNNRIVNPAMQPLKGYWTVIHDGGKTNESWQRVSWNDNLPIAGCGVQAFVRANDDRAALTDGAFVVVSNDVPFSGVQGQFIEVRLGLTRTNASQQPLVYDLTLHALSSAFEGGSLSNLTVYETQNAAFIPVVSGAGPMTYQWYVQYPWPPNQMVLLVSATNASLVLSNLDSWVDGTQVGVWVTNVVGQSMWLGPATNTVLPSAIAIPGTNTFGQASRYPAEIRVFGQPTNIWYMSVILANLSHAAANDLDILLVSPSGTNVMLMSDAGGTNALFDVTPEFAYSGNPLPESDPIESDTYRPANYGEGEMLPWPAPTNSYSVNLYDLMGTDPNGVWKLFIIDDNTNNVGTLQGSWRLEFIFP